MRLQLFDDVGKLYELNKVDHKIIIKENIVQKATDCHLRPNKQAKNRKKCPVCISNDKLKKYEGTIFSMTQRTTNYEEMSLQGSWKPTLQEIIFKCK